MNDAPKSGTETRTDFPRTIETFLERQQEADLLRFITCGSVDDGKSTLIGRLLWDAHQLFDDQIAALRQESKKYGTQGEDIDFALLVDGLSAEREQGITIDVAYRFFGTGKRKFIVADTPGHEQYTRNMATGASTADVAVLLVDARNGILTQTRRHAYICSLMGIRHLVLAVNKMDLVNYDRAVFIDIRESFEDFVRDLGILSVTSIPLSALKGDNIAAPSSHMCWYNGPTLIGYLETVKVDTKETSRLVFPVQWVNRPNSSFRGFSGTIAEGKVTRGEDVRVTASGVTAKISRIVTVEGDKDKALQGEAVTLVLDREIDASRGDVISLTNDPLEMTDQFEATLVWLAEEDGLVGRTYELRLTTQTALCSVTAIKYRINVENFVHEARKTLSLNDICVCSIATNKPIVFDQYENSKILGGFILIDRFSHSTIGAGMIRHNLRRAQNIYPQVVNLRRSDREKLKGHKGKVVWFTGLSGSGKSTIANILEMKLHVQGYHTYLLDGDNIRHGLNKDLGFTDADRVENIRRIAEVARLMLDAGIIVIAAFISPFHQERKMACELIGLDNFLEVYVNTSLETCERRDVKGLYRKAREGLIPNLSGLGSAYEPPSNPDIVVDGENTSPEEAASIIFSMMEKGRR